MTLGIVFTLNIDPSLGRLNYESFSQQALMEMVMSHIGEDYLADFTDIDGNFLDIDEWEDTLMNIDGQIVQLYWIWSFTSPNAGTIFIERLPDSMQDFTFELGDVQGRSHCEKLPKDLIKFSVYNNRLSGSLDLTRLPPNLETFYVSENSFTENLDLTQLPRTLKELGQSSNGFQGVVDVTRLPKGLLHLFLNDNYIFGEVEPLYLPSEIEEFNIENTSLRKIKG